MVDYEYISSAFLFFYVLIYSWAGSRATSTTKFSSEFDIQILFYFFQSD